jgi:hypothetical protein
VSTAATLPNKPVPCIKVTEPITLICGVAVLPNIKPSLLIPGVVARPFPVTWHQLSSGEAQQAITNTGEMIKHFICDHSCTLGPSNEKSLACSLEVNVPFAHF